jgi:AcrR family transcriptional regulator
MAKAKKKQVKREYDNDSRTQKSLENRRLIVEALVFLLVEKEGGDVTFKDIANRTGLAERSIFRFYNDKEQLHAEMDRYLMTYIESSVDQLSTLGVAGFAMNAYRLFDKYESLVMAYIFSPFGQKTRALFRKKLNFLITSKLQAEKTFKLTTENQKKIALICSLINAKIWHDLKIDYGFTGEDMGDAVKWAIESLIKEL